MAMSVFAFIGTDQLWPFVFTANVLTEGEEDGHD